MKEIHPMEYPLEQKEVDRIKAKVNPSENYVGDILVIESSCWQGRLIKPWTGTYNHSAMRTHRNAATAINISGSERYILSKPPKQWIQYHMMRHRGLTDKDRKSLKSLDKLISTEYDFRLLLRLAWRQMAGVEPNMDDISGVGNSCSSKQAFEFHLIGWKVKDDVHYSQVRPSMFLESPYFDEIKYWRKDVRD